MGKRKQNPKLQDTIKSSNYKEIENSGIDSFSASKQTQYEEENNFEGDE